MKSKVIKLFLNLITIICTFVALSTSVSACFWALYQPEEPKCLRK